jgi:hypothetical protein
MTGKSKGVTSIVLVYKGLTSHIEITVEGESLKHHGNLILVAGGGNDTNDPLFDSTQYLSDRVYKVFLTRVFAGSSGFAAYCFFSESLLLSFVGVVICVPVQFITDQVPRITLASISMKRLYEFGEELGHLEKDIAGQETPIRNAEFRALRYEDIFFRYKEDKPIYVFDEWAADQDPHFRQYFYETLLPSFKKQGKTVIAVTHDDRYFHVADQVIQLEYGVA